MRFALAPSVVWAQERTHAVLAPTLARVSPLTAARSTEHYGAHGLHECEHWLIIEASLIAGVTSEVALCTGICQAHPEYQSGSGRALIAVA